VVSGPEPPHRAGDGTRTLGRCPARCCGHSAGRVDCLEFRRVSADRTLEVTICGIWILGPRMGRARREIGFFSRLAAKDRGHGQARAAREILLSACLPGQHCDPVTAVAVSTKAQMMTSCTDLTITTQHHGRRSVLLLQGELDLSTKERLRCAISGALRHCPRVLVLDLSGLDFIDCGGLSVLVWAHKRLAGQERQLLIAGGKPVVRRLIHLAGADTYLHLSAPETGQADSPEGDSNAALAGQ
jgi:anti-sigma B factor antagonist